jgi:hypothetical protein
MINEQPPLLMPPENAVLWRFMDFTKYVSLLDTRHLFFAHLSQMEDKFEGELTKLNAEFQREYLRTEYPGDSDRQDRIFNQTNYIQRDTTCVSCWHMNSDESAAMWKLYLKSDEGVAIRTTFGDMRRAFWNTPDYLAAGVVKYIDFTKDDPGHRNSFELVCRKRRNFAHENEVRLIWWFLNTIKPPIDKLPTFEGTGQPIKVDLAALVQQVYVSPTSTDWFGKLVESVSRRYGLACPVTPSTLFGRPTW